MYVEYGEIKFCVYHEIFSFNLCKSIKQPTDVQVVFVIDMVDCEVSKTIKVNLVDDPLVGALLNLGSKVIR